jgi:hypothetical protein
MPRNNLDRILEMFDASQTQPGKEKLLSELGLLSLGASVQAFVLAMHAISRRKAESKPINSAKDLKGVFSVGDETIRAAEIIFNHAPNAGRLLDAVEKRKSRGERNLNQLQSTQEQQILALESMPFDREYRTVYNAIARFVKKGGVITPGCRIKWITNDRKQAIAREILSEVGIDY